MELAAVDVQGDLEIPQACVRQRSGRRPYRGTGRGRKSAYGAHRASAIHGDGGCGAADGQLIKTRASKRQFLLEVGRYGEYPDNHPRIRCNEMKLLCCPQEKMQISLDEFIEVLLPNLLERPFLVTSRIL